jgi:hypothetical protein
VEWWLPGVGGRERGELLFNGYRISVLQDEKSHEDGCGDGGTLYI